MIQYLECSTVGACSVPGLAMRALNDIKEAALILGVSIFRMESGNLHHDDPTLRFWQ